MCFLWVLWPYSFSRLVTPLLELFSLSIAVCASSYVLYMAYDKLHDQILTPPCMPIYIVLLLIFVDDMIITNFDYAVIQQLKQNLGGLHYFLGLELVGSLNYLTITCPNITFAL
ncbi:hypothetical protein CR513_37760, partial [Mucuna pruriens]